MKHFVEFDTYLKAVFSFPTFIEAIDFINQVADCAEQANHHPDIYLHDYNQVTVILTTHDQNDQITDKDTQLAKQIEALKP